MTDLTCPRVLIADDTSRGRARREPTRRESGPLKSALTWNGATNFFTSFSADFAEGGVFVATDQLLPLGSEVALELDCGEVGGPLIRTQASVVWRRESGAGSDAAPGLGLALATLAETEQAWIVSFLERREPLFFDTWYARIMEAHRPASDASEADEPLPKIGTGHSRLIGAGLGALALMVIALFVWSLL